MMYGIAVCGAFCLALVHFSSGNVSGQDDYSGCYEDVDNLLMPDFQIQLKEINSPRKCQYICRQFQFLYAGLKNGYECLCSREKPGNDKKRQERECNVDCPRCSVDNCGGRSHLAVYSVPSHLPVFTDLSKEWTYIGCYEDSANRLLPNLGIDFSDINNPQKCTGVCNELGFRYSGVEHGVECFCSNDRPTEKRKKPDEECDMACPHSEERCGGEWRIAVYSKVEVSASQLTDDDTSQSFVGCYEDSGNRLLSGYRINLNHVNSPKRCVHICRQLGFRYAGVETGNECFCGNIEPSDIKRKATEDCNVDCPNSQVKCGGPWRLAVYTASTEQAELAVPDGDKKGQYLGCFEDSRERTMPDFRVDMTDINCPHKCVQVCKKLGFRFAGVENRHECFCSKKKPRKQLKRSEEECNTDCPNSGEKCGGSWRVGVYYTFQFKGENKSNGTYLGCFEDTEKQLLPEFQIDFSEINSPDKCIRACKEFGFQIAGLENGYECFCSHYVTSDKRLKDDAACQIPCPQGKDKCGGYSTLAAYGTSLREDTSVLDLISNNNDKITLLGCYDEVGKQLLSGYQIIMGHDIPHKKCVFICSQHGFKYAGIEDERECLCGNQAPRQEKKRSDRDCLSACTNTGEKCGLSWRLTIYET